MIFDTNILIYLSKYILSPQKILIQQAKISVITKIEVLGYQFKSIEEYSLLSNLCHELPVIPLTDDIADETINLRRDNKIKLPDAIIYATALVEGLPLVTNNISDFKSLNRNVKLIDPFTI